MRLTDNTIMKTSGIVVLVLLIYSGGIEAQKNAYSTAATQPAHTGPGCVAKGSTYDYDDVLHKSLLFFEAQRSGYLPATQRVTWRKDSATDDAIDDATQQRVDLEGGYYDDGDTVKFGYPMASMTTVLAWGAIEYGAAYTAAGEMSYLREAVKWSTDYFIKAHPETNVFYGQVGDPELDHNFWGRPEDLTMYRPAFKITTSNPGSDLAGETSAALAAASILFQDLDPTYAATCLQHSKELYDFANQYRGKYANSITKAASEYDSYGIYEDELAWAAAWLYRATGNRLYLKDAMNHYTLLTNDIEGFSWHEKTPGVQVLLAEYADEGDRSTYLEDLKIFCDRLIDSTPRTPLGLVFLSRWGPLRYAVNAAFICLRAADLGISPNKYREFGKQQVHYMLGDGGRSYVVGFGHNSPVRPHHGSSSCPSAPDPCGWDTYSSNKPNAHELTGALVGGPDINDTYVDDRNDYTKNGVTTDANAGFQSTIAVLRLLANCDNITIPSLSSSPNPSLTIPSTSDQTSNAQSTSSLHADVSSTVFINASAPGTLGANTSPVNTEGNAVCESMLVKTRTWVGGWKGTISIPIQTTISSWTVEFEFTSSLTAFEQWTGETTAHSSTLYSVFKDDIRLSTGETLAFDFLCRFNEGDDVSVKSLKLNGQTVYTNKGASSAVCINEPANTSPASTASNDLCEDVLVSTHSWNAGWTGTVCIPIQRTISSWTVEFEFTGPLTKFEQWTGGTTSHSNTLYSVSKDNFLLSAGETLSFDFLCRFKVGDNISVKSLKLNGETVYTNRGSVPSAPQPKTDCRLESIIEGTCTAFQDCPFMVKLLEEVKTGSAPASYHAFLKKSICQETNNDVTICCPGPGSSLKPPQGQDVLSGQCGVRFRSSERTVGSASLGDWPWMVAIMHQGRTIFPGFDPLSVFGNNVFISGGTLINDRYILSTAQGFPQRRATGEFVRIGEHNWKEAKDCQFGVCAPPPQDIPVESIIVHPSYQFDCDACHDIALLRLSKPATLHPLYAMPICLPPNPTGDLLDLRGKTAWAAGWGSIVPGPTAVQHPSILQQVHLPVQNLPFCDNAKSSYPDSAMVICAGGEGLDMCRGDEGGPLTLTDSTTGKDYLIGVTSVVLRECGAKGKQTLYTNVYYYLSWINRNIRP